MTCTSVGTMVYCGFSYFEIATPAWIALIIPIFILFILHKTKNLFVLLGLIPVIISYANIYSSVHATVYFVRARFYSINTSTNAVTDLGQVTMNALTLNSIAYSAIIYVLIALITIEAVHLAFKKYRSSSPFA